MFRTLYYLIMNALIKGPSTQEIMEKEPDIAYIATIHTMENAVKRGEKIEEMAQIAHALANKEPNEQERAFKKAKIVQLLGQTSNEKELRERIEWTIQQHAHELTLEEQQKQREILEKITGLNPK